MVMPRKVHPPAEAGETGGRDGQARRQGCAEHILHYLQTFVGVNQAACCSDWLCILLNYTYVGTLYILVR
jgi:hypothetical protein